MSSMLRVMRQLVQDQKHKGGSESKKERKGEDSGTNTSSRTSFVCIVAVVAVGRPQQQIPAHLSAFTVKQATFEYKSNNGDVETFL